MIRRMYKSLSGTELFKSNEILLEQIVDVCSYVSPEEYGDELLDKYKKELLK